MNASNHRDSHPHPQQIWLTNAAQAAHLGWRQRKIPRGIFVCVIPLVPVVVLADPFPIHHLSGLIIVIAVGVVCTGHSRYEEEHSLYVKEVICQSVSHLNA